MGRSRFSTVFSLLDGGGGSALPALEVREFESHAGAIGSTVMGIVFSVDGKFLLASTDDGGVGIWDVESPQRNFRSGKRGDTYASANFGWPSSRTNTDLGGRLR